MNHGAIYNLFVHILMVARASTQYSPVARHIELQRTKPKAIDTINWGPFMQCPKMHFWQSSFEIYTSDTLRSLCNPHKCSRCNISVQTETDSNRYTVVSWIVNSPKHLAEASFKIFKIFLTMNYCTGIGKIIPIFPSHIGDMFNTGEFHRLHKLRSGRSANKWKLLMIR